MTIPLIVFFVPYSIVIGLIIIFSMVNLFHLLHYGFFYFGAALFSYFFFGIMIIALFWTYQQLSIVDWQNTTVTINSLF